MKLVTSLSNHLLTKHLSDQALGSLFPQTAQPLISASCGIHSAHPLTHFDGSVLLLLYKEQIIINRSVCKTHIPAFVSTEELWEMETVY